MIIQIELEKLDREFVVSLELSRLNLSMHISPANSTLAVGGSFGHRQGLTHLGLGEAQGKSPELEGLGELLDLVQIDAVDHVGGCLVDGGFI